MQCTVQALLCLDVYLSLDGTDCQTAGPIRFDRKWTSHKLKEAGTRYKLVFSLHGRHIVRVNGSLACQSWPDISMVSPPC